MVVLLHFALSSSLQLIIFSSSSVFWSALGIDDGSIDRDIPQTYWGILTSLYLLSLTALLRPQTHYYILPTSTGQSSFFPAENRGQLKDGPKVHHPREAH